MGNEIDKAKLQNITAVFDRSALVIKDLADEIISLTGKFGTASKLVEHKKEQLQTLRSLYDQSLDYINYLRELNNSMYTEFMFEELRRAAQSTGLPISKIMSLAGDDDPKWKEVDKWDDTINRIHDVLKIPKDPDELPALIERLRGGLKM